MKRKITSSTMLLFFIGVALLVTGPLRVTAQDYCEPSVYYVSSNNWIVDVETTGGVTNIDNPTGSAEYTDYSDDEIVSAVQGTTVNFTLNAYPSGSMCYARIWVDWNQDGDFEDAGETVFDVTTGGGALTFTGTITVPMDADTGTTRMRVRTDWYSTTGSGFPLPDPCEESGWGEAEDYGFKVIASEPCSGTITAGTAVAVDSICPSISFIVTATDATIATGMESQWQKSATATGPWTATGTTGTNYYETSGITANTYYRYYTTCTASGSTDTSNVIEVVVKAATECYCTPSGMSSGYGCSSWRIDDVTTTGGIDNISNVNSNCSSGSYGSFLDMKASQYQGSTINYSIKTEYSYGTTTGYVTMWIDWNQDGVFASSEVIYGGGNTSGTPLTGTFEIPSDAVAGSTRMRVKTQQYSSITDPCVFSTYTYGEVEDYTFEVLVPDPCDDAEFTDITISGPEAVCSGVDPFTLTTEGTPVASGLTKVWESAPAGSGDWTVIAGATMSYLNVSSITAATDYRYTVTCVATGEEESATWTVNLNPPTECYCDVTYMYGCTYYYINDFEVTGGISDLSNLGSGCSGTTGYGDFTDMSASAYQGTVVNYNINLYSTYTSCKLWIDWNQDGDYDDAGELMYNSGASGYAPTSISGSFEVPYTALAGETGMRLRTFNSWGYDYFTACYNYGWGETEDYKFNVVEPDPCDEVPFTGLSIDGPSSICATYPFSITSDGTPVASGLTRIWQQKPEGGDWTTISGATSLTCNISGITVATDFRYIVLCTISGESDTSNVISVTLNPPTECYCKAEFYNAYYTDAYSEWGLKTFILRGQTDTLDHSPDYPFEGTTTGILGGYGDYTSDTPTVKIPDLVQTGIYSGTVKPRYSSSGTIDKVWIDYDDDGFFESTEAIHASSTSYPGFSSGSPDNFTFSVPLMATPGIHRLRVRTIAYYYSPLPIDPCFIYPEGETQDYLVEIVELKPCAEVTFPESVGAYATPPNVCGSGDINLNLSATMPLAAGVTYQWKSSTSEDGSYTNVGPEIPAIDGPSLTVTGVSTDKYYRCYVLCDGEPILISDAVYVQSVDVDAVVVTTEDGQTCGPGTVTLTGSTTDGSVFWYLNPAGGSPVWMGDTYTTPPLTVTDTFYATGGAFGASDGIVGTGTGTSSIYDYGPFVPYYGAKAMQYMYTADDLHAAGLNLAGDIQSIAFNLASLPDIALTDYTIKMKTVTTAPPMSWQTSGWTSVYYTSSLMPTATGWVTFPLSTAFPWNGTDNIIIQICFKTPDAPYYYYYYPGGTHKYTSKTGQCMTYYNYSTTTDACASSYYSTTSSALPNAKFYIPGCETSRVPVVAYVRPVPDPINIGADETICKDPENGLTLDAGPQPETYTFLWDNGETQQTRRITESGTYYVTVANEYGCGVYDTVTKTLLDIPMVDLGNDTTVCEGGTLMLDAGDDGSSYYWSNGATTPTIDIIAGGEYSVVVANTDGCMSLDTINITVSGTMPSVASIIVTNTDLYTFSFEPLLPAHIVTYSWDFGDGSTSDEEAPTHTYAASGSYTITLTVRSECGEVVYTTTAHIVGVANVNIDDQSVTLYPNPAHELAVIESKGDLVMKSVTVTNVLGQVMYQAEADAPGRHQMDLSRYASGIYTVRIDTDKGVIVRKFEIVK